MCFICGISDASSGFQASAIGSGFPVSAAPSYSLPQIVQQLRTSWLGYEGETYPADSSGITYAVLTSAPLDSSPENSGWQAMTSLMAARATEAFELWDDLIATGMTGYVGNPPSGADVIQFAYSTATDGSTYEYGDGGYYDGLNEYGGSNYVMTRGEVWLDSAWSTHSTSSALNQAGYAYYGGYGFQTYMHEIGHALGLSHPGAYNVGVGNPAYATDAVYAQDTHKYTIMSYFDADEDGSGTDHFGSDNSWRYSQTPMVHDIAAIQAIYGADVTTRATGTTYGFNSTAGLDVYDFTRNINPIITIYDAGGTDTLDLSGFGSGQYAGQRIDLTPGSFSDVGGYMTFNLSIAFSTTIENATGGSGDDTMTGNSVGNNMNGGSGTDSINGGDGNDTLGGGIGNDVLNGGNGHDVLDGGTGSDTMYGGVGNDVFYVDNAGDQCIEQVGEGTSTVYTSVSYTLGANLNWLILQEVGAISGAGNDLANSILGNAFDNALDGGAGNDVLQGNNGNDTLYGGLGADTMYGGIGNDAYYIDNAGDSVVENAAEGTTDTIYAIVSHVLGANVENLVLQDAGGTVNGTGNVLANSLVGNSGDNTLDGAGGADLLQGAGGNDVLVGGAGNDTLFGGDGADIYFVDSSSDIIGELANQGYDAVYSTVSFILSADVEQLVLQGTANLNGIGNTLANTIIGNSGFNSFAGGDGGDALYGMDGNDTLDGGVGADYLDGGKGVDTFYVDSLSDVVVDTASDAGQDTVLTMVDFALPANVEVLVFNGGAGALNMIGNNLANVVLGNNFANSILTLEGNDYIVALGGADTIDGGAGMDFLFGGVGADFLTGGAGNDFFSYTAIGEAGDLITDFTTTAGANADVLDLRSMFTGFTGAFGATAVSAIASGHLVVQQSGGDALVSVDANGGAHPGAELVFLAQLQNTTASALLNNILVA